MKIITSIRIAVLILAPFFIGCVVGHRLGYKSGYKDGRLDGQRLLLINCNNTYVDGDVIGTNFWRGEWIIWGGNSNRIFSSHSEPLLLEPVEWRELLSPYLKTNSIKPDYVEEIQTNALIWDGKELRRGTVTNKVYKSQGETIPASQIHKQFAEISDSISSIQHDWFQLGYIRGQQDFQRQSIGIVRTNKTMLGLLALDFDVDRVWREYQEQERAQK